MPQAKVLSDAFSFTPSQLLELWKLDCTTAGLDAVYYFCNSSSANFNNIVFAGTTYMPYPIECKHVDTDGKGTISRPQLSVSNINGYISTLLLANNTTLEGATVTRTRVHARFIDAVNFPDDQPLPLWVTPDTTATYAPEPFVINRLITQNPQIIQWELMSPLEMQNAKLPRRQVIANTCMWKYRQPGTCDFSGDPIADRANRLFATWYKYTLAPKGMYDPNTIYNQGDWVTTTSNLPQFAGVPLAWVCTTNGTMGVTPTTSSSNWVAEQCSKTSAGCKLRYPNTPLRTSAIPGAARAGWVAT